MSTEMVKSSQEIEKFNFFNQGQFEVMQRVAMVFANSELVPEMYRITATNPKEKAIANNIIALEMASRIGASPLMVMQNLYIVYGNPGWSSKFLTATVNTCGRYETIKYKLEQKGTVQFGGAEIENWECIAYTSEKGSGEVLESTPVTIKMAIAEGWYGKKGSKWPNMPKLMLKYRSVAFWTREYAPELSMGMKTSDELEDIIPYEDVTEKVKQEVATNANKTEISIEATPPADQPGAVVEPANQNGQAAMSGPGF